MTSETNMKNVKRGVISFCVLILAFMSVAARADGNDLKTLWKIGRADAAYSEFSTRPAKYWMDKYQAEFTGRFRLVAGEKLKKDVFPGLQAGPDDGWGGLKEHPLDIEFTLDEAPAGGAALTVGFAGVWSGGSPVLRAGLNGVVTTQPVPKGGDSSVILAFTTNSGAEKSTDVSFYFPANALKKGANRLTLTIVEGSWLIYDFIKMETAADPSKSAVMGFAADSPPFLVERGGAVGHLIRAKGVFIGAETDATLRAVIDGKEFKENVKLKPGAFNLELKVPERKTKTAAKATLVSGGRTLGGGDATLTPVRHAKIYLIAHSHFDIGYPDLQSNILIAQKRYFEQALDIAGRGGPSPMKWTAEISWLQWLLKRNIGVWDEYGKWMPDTPLTRSVPDSFYKEYLSLRNIAYQAEVSSSAPKRESLNKRRAVDGSPMGWNSVGPARGAYIELNFARPEKLEYVAVRDARELEDNPIRYVRVTLSDGKRRFYSAVSGPVGADRERLLVPVGGKSVKMVRIDVVSARDDNKPVGIMEVEAFQKVSPEETRKLMLAQMRDGRMEMTAMYMNFLTQLTPTEWLIRSFLRSNEVAREAGVKLETALMTDVPGFSFALPDVLSGAGIKYFYPALNADHARNCLKGIPRAFIWEGPGGGRIIVFHSFESYNEGWSLGFTLSADDVERKLPDFLARLDAENYQYDAFPLRTLGDITDDGPAAELLPQVAAEWNSRWAYPQVVIGTPSEFFKEFDRKYGKTLPTLRGDWTSSWEDGEGSTAEETILVRNAHRDQLFASAFGAVSGLLLGGNPKLKKEMDAAGEDIYLYDEHTWGADMSVWNPYSLQTTGQWELKKMPAHDAPLRFAAEKELLKPLAERYAPRAKRGGKILAVMNSTGAARSGYVKIPAPAGKTYKVYDAADGKVVPSAAAAGADGKNEVVFVADGMPGVGIMYY